MEKRIIRVTDETLSFAVKIESEADTLGQFKAELDQAGIDYKGKEFTEGRTRTRLLDDSSALPDEVMFRGQPTRELSIVLMTPDKKVSSGSERSDIFARIKELGLAEKVKEVFGRNHTLVSTSDLQKFLRNNGRTERPEEKTRKENKREDVLKATPIEEKEAAKESVKEHKKEEEGTSHVCAKAIKSLVDLLVLKRILTMDEAKEVIGGKYSIDQDKEAMLKQELKSELGNLIRR